VFVLFPVLRLRDELILPSPDLPRARRGRGFLSLVVGARDERGEETLEVLRLARRALRRGSRPHQRLEFMSARAAVEVVQRHRSGPRSVCSTSARRRNSDPELRPRTPTPNSDPGLRPRTPTLHSDPGLRPRTATAASAAQP